MVTSLHGASGDGYYEHTGCQLCIALPAQDVNATNADDDTAGFTLISDATLTQPKPVARTHLRWCWMLNRASDVVFTISSNDTSEGLPDLSTLTFTSANWDTPQTVAVTGEDDTLIDGDIPYIVQVAVDAVNTLDADFVSLPAQDVSATNADDDTAGFTLNTTTLSIRLKQVAQTRLLWSWMHNQARMSSLPSPATTPAKARPMSPHSRLRLPTGTHRKPSRSQVQTIRSLMVIFLTSCKSL
jgi:hypothetical protein